MINIWFLVAGSNTVGIGNLMRSISLAKYVKRESTKTLDISFVIEKDQNLLKNILVKNNFENIFESVDLSSNLDVQAILQFIKNEQVNVIITDLPNIDQDQMDLLKKNNLVISFDEHKRISNWGNIVINYNAYAINWQYFSDRPYFIQLIGPKYFLLRDEVSKIKVKSINEREIDLVLSFGGSDPTGLTLIVFNTIKEKIIQFKLQTYIILGPLYDSRFEIKIEEKYQKYVKILTDPLDYLEIIASTKLLLCSAGNTSFETAYLGTPIIMINHNEIQNINAEAWKKLRNVKNLGLFDNFNHQELLNSLETFYKNPEIYFNEIFFKGRQLVDEFGSERIFKKIALIIKKLLQIQI